MVRIKVQPRASKNCFLGQQAGELKVALAAVPDHGRANQALINFLAQTLKLAKSSITITHGKTNQHKIIRILAPSTELIATIAKLAGEL